MQFLDAATLSRRLVPGRLIEALREGLGDANLTAPLRHAHELRSTPDGSDSLLLMPAWDRGSSLGVKLVTAMTSDPERSGRTVNSLYVLFDGASGEPVACLDGDVLTVRRTAAQSALAAQMLARADATRLLMVGTGALSQAMVEAHAVVRRLSTIQLWGRRRPAAEARAAALCDVGIAVTVVDDLQAAVAEADIICCATTAREPVVAGKWLRPGQHVDLVGSFRSEMREVDAEAVTRASLFVDSIDGCLKEAGDLVQPIAAGLLDPARILSDIDGLCASRHGGRTSVEEITLFKSVGTARADLLAARLALNSEGPVA